MNSSTSYFLNASRWIAAFLVLTSHIKGLILVDYPLVENKSTALQALYSVTGLGHEAVVVFFVISGFLVGGLGWDKWQQKGFALSEFAVARISRIYTVLIPTLILGVALDSIGLKSFNQSGLYTHAADFHTGSIGNAVGVIEWTTVLGNLLMLQNISVSVAGSNGPLWSLANEWWYYCIFAGFGATFYSYGIRRVAFAIGTLATLYALPFELTLWGLVWVIGILAFAWNKSSIWKPAPLLGIGLALIALLASRLSHGIAVSGASPLIVGILKDLALATCFMVALVSSSRLSKKLPSRRLNQNLADFSFTTYLLHFPLMLFLVAVGFQLLGLRFRVQPDAFGLSYLAALVLLVSILCYLMSLLTERHTGYFRKKLNTAFEQTLSL